jgi:hypothetical protein
MSERPEKLDLRRQLSGLYRPSAKTVEEVHVPDLLYLAVDGRVEGGVGPGESEDFAAAMGAMYGVAYGLKFMSKLDPVHSIDFKLMAMEGLWAPESGVFEWGKPEPWLYTLIMVQPGHITEAMLSETVAKTREKRPNPALDLLRLERWKEGQCIQIMHIGPYADEPRTLAMMDEYADEHGLDMIGRHHEIYLGDPRRAQPDKLKTILRHPVSARP